MNSKLQLVGGVTRLSSISVGIIKLQNAVGH